GHAYVRYLDHLERGLVHGRLEVLVAVPVAVRLLHHDAALEQEAFQDLADVELVVARLPHAERDVLEVAEQGHAAVVVGGVSIHRMLQGVAAGDAARRVTPAWAPARRP